MIEASGMVFSVFCCFCIWMFAIRPVSNIVAKAWATPPRQSLALPGAEWRATWSCAERKRPANRREFQRFGDVPKRWPNPRWCLFIPFVGWFRKLRPCNMFWNMAISKYFKHIPHHLSRPCNIHPFLAFGGDGVTPRVRQGRQRSQSSKDLKTRSTLRCLQSVQILATYLSHGFLLVETVSFFKGAKSC